MEGGDRASLDDPGFDPSTLVYWRKRIAKSERPHRVNDAVKTVIGQTGILKGRRRRAVDSTILADAVATQDTVTQLISRDPPGGGGRCPARRSRSRRCAPGTTTPGRASRRSTGTTRPRRTRWCRRWSTTRTRWWPRSPAGAWTSAAASAVALLALVAGQDVEPAEGSDGTDGRWRIARKVAEDRVISAVDPDARHTRKSPEARRDGYRAHVAAEPETGIITDEKLTRAAGRGELRPGGRGGVPRRRGTPAAAASREPAQPGRRRAG